MIKSLIRRVTEASQQTLDQLEEFNSDRKEKNCILRKKQCITNNSKTQAFTFQSSAWEP